MVYFLPGVPITFKRNWKHKERLEAHHGSSFLGYGGEFGDCRHPMLKKTFYGEVAMIFFPHVKTYIEGKLSRIRYVPYAAKHMKQLSISFGNVLQPWMSGV